LLKKSKVVKLYLSKERGTKMQNKLIVQKYGGTSVGGVERIEKVCDRIISYAKKGNKLAVVVSAMGDTTDELIELSKKINPDPEERKWICLYRPANRYRRRFWLWRYTERI
jgi:aspartokinase